MPVFYFDIHDGEHETRADRGVELEDACAARDQAISVLPSIAREVLPDGGQRTFVASVRNDDGEVVFRATLALTSEWFGTYASNPAARRGR